MLNTETEALVIEERVQEITEEMREDDEQVTCFLKLAGIMSQKQIVLNGFRIYAQKTIRFMLSVDGLGREMQELDEIGFVGQNQIMNSL